MHKFGGLDKAQISLVTLTSRFEATRGLFWRDLVILNRGWITGNAPELAAPCAGFHTTPTGGLLLPAYFLTCNRTYTQHIFGKLGFRTWSPAATGPAPYH
ncbi:hypothetical protein AVEN_5429-1 [Araneus ventricosus]|uniref:Uncharacterized protein n=1 Tax=Araneus ventricosus TaxID=182803 RepID=A0A4Y2VZC6_ARAVE|nr:hypothetical protein AVEN_5429-1 [Araneus ventricosus]